MPRGKSSNEEEKRKIKQLRCKLELSGDIANGFFKRSKKVLGTFIREPKLYGKIEWSGRLPQISSMEKRRLVREAHKRGKSTSEF